MVSVGLVFEEKYFWHQSHIDFGDDVHPGFQLETPEPRRRLLDLLHRRGLTDAAKRLRAVELSRVDLTRVHDDAYVERIAAMNSTGGEAGELTPFGRGSYDIALLAAGGVYAAVQAVRTQTVLRSFALVRPPGHHAERDRGRGYCVFANIAVALEKARADGVLGRVAVIDWDVHHGNGTQLIYYDDPDTLTVSLHQDRLYPRDLGMVTEVGGSGAEGSNVNIPLPAGSGNGAYLAAWDDIVAPAVREFAPDLIVVASGLDASAYDPNAHMLVTVGGFRSLARRAIGLAREAAQGQLVVVQEGGYSPFYVPLCGTAIVEELLDHPIGVKDPAAFMDDLPAQQVAPHQAEAIERAYFAWRHARRPHLA